MEAQLARLRLDQLMQGGEVLGWYRRGFHRLLLCESARGASGQSQRKTQKTRELSMNHGKDSQWGQGRLAQFGG
jgi:hypothetical protein